MRERKFRAWHRESKQMLYGTPAQVFRWLEEGQPIDVEEYIGRKDDGSNEVYEGDIVIFFKGYVDDTWTDLEQGLPYVIEWNNSEGYLGFYAKRGNRRIIPMAGQSGKYKWKWTVIGNIHDNPELIKP